MQYGVKLASYTSWRVGGEADRFLQVGDANQLVAELAKLPIDEPLLWVGKGSNLLIRDGGFRGTVIHFAQGEEALSMLTDGRIQVGAGVSLPRLSRYARGQGWRALDFVAGIPGSVGGALAMNAGAFGQAFWELVDSVEVVNRAGVRLERSPDQYRIGYRTAHPPGEGEEWFLAATLSQQRFQPNEHQKSMQQQLKQRNRTQPMAEFSCGSVFRNPVGDHAGRLIEQAGLKGCTIGGARVSERHANFIVHSGEATAADIESLIQYVQHEVEARFGIRLELEVRIVGKSIS